MKVYLSTYLRTLGCTYYLGILLVDKKLKNLITLHECMNGYKVTAFMTFEFMQGTQNSICFIKGTQMNVLTKVTKDQVNPYAPS